MKHSTVISAQFEIRQKEIVMNTSQTDYIFMKKTYRFMEPYAKNISLVNHTAGIDTYI